MRDKSTKWSAWFKETAEYQVRWHGDPPRELRWKLVVVSALTTLAFGWFGYQLLTSNFRTSDTPVAIVPNKGADQVLPSASSSIAIGAPIQIDSVSSYDPFGDQKENDNELKQIIDADPISAWNTSTYKNAEMGKAGVGIIFDLGKSKTVSQVVISFKAAGQSGAIYITDELEPNVKTAIKLGDLNSSSIEATVKGKSTLTGRYVLVWLTELPSVANGFASGIASVQVLL